MARTGGDQLNQSELDILLSLTEVTYVDDSGGGSTINLPTAVGKLNQRIKYTRTDGSSNLTTFTTTGSETINNVDTFTLGEGESITFISDDSDWFID